MKILAIDSSSVSAGAAVVSDGKLLSECFVNAGLTHSRTLLCLIDGALKNACVSLADIGVIAAVNGPGSFTGVRIGVSAAKGLAQAAEIPCLGISALETCAFSLSAADAAVCAAMDARCSQVYTALFACSDGEVRRLTPDEAISLEELSGRLEKMDGRILAAGDGGCLVCDYMRAKGIPVVPAPAQLMYQRASAAAFAALAKLEAGAQPVSAHALLPVYLRLSQAERKFEK